jgi:Stress responsive A/B Barrel Domain
MTAFSSLKILVSSLFVALSLLAATVLPPAISARPQFEGKVLRHVVLFKFKESTTPQEIKKIEAAFRALPSKINVIRSFEWGTNVSQENLNQGYTHCFLLTFASDKDRDAYLVHPAHKEFGNILGSSLDKVLVVDFWAEK